MFFRMIVCTLVTVASLMTTAATAETLKTPAEFDSIRNQTNRSVALFTEAGRVLQHPRCLNCHPRGDRPTQGLDLHPHEPMVVRGKDGHGAIGLPCTACHQAFNFEPSRVPGHPLWHLAPPEMAWQGLTLGQLCTQLKDPARNGGRTLAQIEEHMAEDTLVGWAWRPGGGREPAPGTQAGFGALIAAWIETGASCPAS